MIRTLLLAAAIAVSLGGCADLELPEPGFITHAFDDDDGTPVNPNACTAARCAQAPQFCAARGYTPGTPAFARCLVSVQENLRKNGS